MKNRIVLFISFYLLVILVFSPLYSVKSMSSNKQLLKAKKISMVVESKKKLSVILKAKRNKWTSSNKKVATVSKKGIVNALKKGKTKISISNKFGKDSCTVYVINKVKADNSSSNNNEMTPKKSPIAELSNNVSPPYCEGFSNNISESLPNQTTIPCIDNDENPSPSPTFEPYSDDDLDCPSFDDSFIPGDLIITFKMNYSEDEVRDMLIKYTIEDIENIDSLCDFYMYKIQLTTKTKERVIEAIKLLQNAPQILYADVNHIIDIPENHNYWF